MGKVEGLQGFIRIAPTKHVKQIFHMNKMTFSEERSGYDDGYD